MTTTQTIQWIALPNGFDADGQLRLSVFLAPRLRTDEGITLDLFPDFLDWAARMQPDAISFEIEVEGEPAVPTSIVSPAPDAALWASLFNAQTPVKPFDFNDYADRPLVSFPVSRTLDFMKKAYVDLAKNTIDDLPDAVPDGAGTPNLVDTFEPLIQILRSRSLFEGIRDEKDFSRRLTWLLEGARAEARRRRAAPSLVPQPMIEPIPTQLNDPGSDLQQAFFFHQRPIQEPVAFPQTQNEAEAHFKAEIDFHQMLSALGDYPLLMRQLGLVFDLTLPADSIPQQPGGVARRLRVIPHWASNFPPRVDPNPPPWTFDYTPWTLFYYLDFQGKLLFVSAADGLAQLLPLKPAGFDVTQVDVDGAVLKAFGLAETLVQKLDEPMRPIEESKKAGAPALRTGGIALVRQGQAQDVHNDFYSARKQNNALETDPDHPIDLNALDLVRGYRLDVWNGSQHAWFSLHARKGTYNPLDFAGGAFDLDDEGFSQLGVSGQADGVNAPADPDSELYVHENLLTWDGWSMSAPRPGRSISRDSRAPDPDIPETQPQEVPNTAMTEMRLEVSFKPQANSLPRLRFGQEYRLRLRTVDLAGNSLTLAEADEMTEFLEGLDPGLVVMPSSNALLYARFEPVPAPTLVPRLEFGEGESAERMVIRSNFDQSPEEYAQDHAQYVPFCDRHVAPPKAALQMVETHGMLDAAFGPGATPADKQALYDIAVHERGSFSDPAPGMRFIHTSGDPNVDDPNRGYAVHDVDQVTLPYLPDPYADGAVFYGLPGVPMGQAFEVAFDRLTDWHDPQPLRLRLIEGNGAPVWDAATRVLSVFMPRGRWEKVRVSSRFAGEPRVMGLLQWCLEATDNGIITPAEMDSIMNALKQSRHWMFTPWRDLTLVHAVQQPLDLPGFRLENLTAQQEFARSVGETAAGLAATVDFDGPSTARIDLVAQWRIPQDDPSMGPPRYGDDMLDFRTQVLKISIPDKNDTPIDPLLAHDLQYADERQLMFSAARSDVRAMIQSLLSANPPLAQRIRLENALKQLDQVLPHEFGDTKYRRVVYQVTATSRFREYFPPEITAQPGLISRTSAPITVEMLSSAPPAKPKLRYVVPLLRWEEQGAPGDASRESVRHGGAIRVYLDRSWFSSGDGELLGLVIGSVATVASNDYSLITYWGRDPAWGASKLPIPTGQSFKNAVAVKSGITLRETFDHQLGTKTYTVVGFEAAFDAARDLWYCDIEFDTEQAYFPFVRLGLVRFQPNSVKGVEVSPVVLADFVQTLPDRALSVMRDPDQPNAVNLSLSGPAPTTRWNLHNGTVLTDTNNVIAHLERRNSAIADETLGWEPLPNMEIPLTSQPGPNQTVLWSGQMLLPEGGDRLRVVVREFETYAADNRAAVLRIDPKLIDAKRLVHLDTLEL